MVVADGGLPAVQALVRWDAVTHAERELAERRTLGFPPATRMAAVTGPAAAVRELLSLLELTAGAEVLADTSENRLMLRYMRSAEMTLDRSLKTLQKLQKERAQRVAEWPEAATWGEWIDRFTALAVRALRRPTRVRQMRSPKTCYASSA